MKTRITELLGVQYPLLQGGMAWIADSQLAAAVSNAGGVGLIAGGAAPVDYIRDQIRKAKELTDKPFGVNIMLISPYFFELLFSSYVPPTVPSSPTKVRVFPSTVNSYSESRTDSLA